MKKIVEASLLSFNIQKLEEQIVDLKNNGIFNVHYDVMDGKFVPNTAFGPEHLSLLKKHKMVVSVHLMVLDPLKWIFKFAKKPVKYLTFHIEPISIFKYKLCCLILKARGIKCGIAIKPQTDANKYFNILKKCKIVTIMGVEPGKGGQSFLENSMVNLQKVKKIQNENNSSLVIQLDGGVNFEVIKNTKQYVDFFVSGSFLMHYEGDKKDIVKEISN